MAEIGLTYQTGVPTTIGTLALDALITEGTDLRAKATEYAVEDGSPISDHVVLESERLKLSGWITTNSVMEMTADGRPKLLEAKATLRRLVSDRNEIVVATGLDTYANMVLESANIGRSNEGDHLTVDLELVQIRKAVLRQADIPPAKTSGTGTGKAGTTKTPAGKANSNNEPSGPKKSKLAELIDR